MISTNPLEWNVRCFAGFDRAKEAPPFNISPTAFSAAENKRSVDYTTTGNFLLEGRLQLWWANANSISGEKSAIISAVLGARLIGQ